MGDKPGAMDQATTPDQVDEVAVLLLRCRDADGAAFERLYQLQSPVLYAVAIRITRNAALASDVVHDALLQVWRNADRYDPERGNPRAWLLSLVRYRALDAIRRHSREVAGEVPDRPDTDPDPLDRMMATSEGEALRRCLDQVPEERRSWVVMAFLDGLTHMELAQRLGQPLGTVKSGLRRTLHTLRACLDGTA